MFSPSLRFLSFAALVACVSSIPTTRTLDPVIKNMTCVLSPDTARVDWVENPPVVQNIADGQNGVALTLDVGVLDISTCEPATNIMVEVWAPNALGEYGTFLRGATLTASNGIAEFEMIFPGFSSNSANHINVAIHEGSDLSSATVHVGQLFFTDVWTTIVGMYPPYNTNTNTRILNSQDSSYATANSGGYSPIIDVESIEDDWPEGVIGSITVGIDSTTF